MSDNMAWNKGKPLEGFPAEEAPCSLSDLTLPLCCMKNVAAELPMLTVRGILSDAFQLRKSLWRKLRPPCYLRNTPQPKFAIIL